MKYIDDARDSKFNLFEWLDLDQVLRAERYKEFKRDDLAMILDEALKVAQGEVAPTNEEGDRIGAQWADGKVTLPPSFHKAFKTVAEGGWIGASANPEFGGMGLPECVGTAINEYLMGANASLSLTMILGRGCSHLIETFGTDEMKALYCEKLYTGVWSGTMCLTEAGAGSDLNDIKTKAVKQEDGSYKITGEKIFITSGDQDITPNIIHAVLARTPDAPTGVKGLSLFVVPKIRVNPDGSLGGPNDVKCAGIEHKLGIHGSPTCSLVFGSEDGCVGYLLGKERQGLLNMFQMMNAARYEVGLQGHAVASAAHQAALGYAKERLQGRHFMNREPNAPATSIVEHPDVRRMLMAQSSYVQAMRALLSYTAYSIDMAKVATGDEQKRHQGLVELLTPICKAWCSDWGFKVTEWAVQTYGGYGYCQEYPAEQYLRDEKICSIYEGTNGIQALDLVFRKFKMQGGEPVKALLDQVSGTVQSLVTDAVLGGSAMHLRAALKELSGILMEVPKRLDAGLVLLTNAVPILDMVGHVFAGSLLLEQAAVAQPKLAGICKEKGVHPSNKDAFRRFLEDNSEARFYHQKVQAAIFFAHRALPNVAALAVGVKSNESSSMDVVF